MKYASTLTIKGQVTMPVEIRRMLKLMPGDQVQFRVSGNDVVVRKNDWAERLHMVQEQNVAYMSKNDIKALSDEELDEAIDRAAEASALERHKRILEP